MIYELAEGLHYCHRQGVLHRNLKPENVMVNDKGHVVIADFSLSRLVTVPHAPYTPEVIAVLTSRIQKKGSGQVGRPEDCGTGRRSCYSEGDFTHLKWTCGRWAVCWRKLL